MNGPIECVHCIGRAGNAPEPTIPGTAADSQQHERHGVANADAAADETARVRRLHDDVESVVGVQ
jgi:hypothetical protein